MTTPICDFVRRYAQSGTARLHMPGHKGTGPLGCEALDITEISGADDLAAPEGIIEESEANASALFGSRRTLYSAGGSSQCVKAMVHLALLHRPAGTEPVILAGRNAHKAFLHACALLDVTPQWLYPDAESSLCACPITAEGLETALSTAERRPMAVYLTSPDYLGGMLDIAALSAVCRAHGVPLLVDNAHGAYLKFLPHPAHPLDLGAALCCDSAHKTLPVLTGGAYLHIGKDALAPYEADARECLALFGSSSPSYLILQSLDYCNARLAGDFPARLAEMCRKVEALKTHLREQGIPLRGTEPMKIVVDAAAGGLDGRELAEILRRHGVEPEYADPDALVLMPAVDTPEADLVRVEEALSSVVLGTPRLPLALPHAGRQVLTPRQAMLSPREHVAAEAAAGRVCAGAAVSCPPAIPIAVMGEEITRSGADLMARLGITQVPVVRKA